jgi:hypothetical protein
MTDSQTQMADTTDEGAGALPTAPTPSSSSSSSFMSVDKSKLEKELSSAFVTDAKRKAEDTMKKKAILTARSYDEFRHLVAAATQKPLEKGDLGKRAELSANRAFGASGASTSASSAAQYIAAQNFGFGFPAGGVGGGPGSAAAASATAAAALRGGQATTVLPSSGGDVDRAWRRLPSKPASVRYGYLAATVGPERLAACFKADIDGTLLGNLLLGVAAAGAEAEAATAAAGGEGPLPSPPTTSTSSYSPTQACEILLALSKGGRFDLARDLLSAEELAAAGKVAAGAERAGDAGKAAAVRAAYGMG